MERCVKLVSSVPWHTRNPGIRENCACVAQASTFKTVYLVIDALDICTNGDDERTRHSIHQALKKLPHNIRVLFTSRSDSLTRDLGVSQKLQVTPNQSDIETYVKDRIDGDSVLHRVLEDTKHREDVVRRVSELTKTGGMFLLARLHMDNLSKQGTLADIKDALCRLPATSSLAFEASIRRILRPDNAFESDLAKHVLTWVVHAKVGLTMNQVGDSFAIYKSKGYRDPDGKSALYWAFCYERYPAVKLLIEHGADVTEKNVDGWTPLIEAVRNRNEDIVWLLIKMGAQVDQTDSKGWSPLLYAIENQSKNMVWLLIANKANVKPRNDKGMTLLHRACHGGRLKEVAFLLENGAETRSKDTAGFTALHYAVLRGWDEIVGLLASWGSVRGIIDEPDAKGNRAVMLATLQKSKAMVQALIDNGASCEDRDLTGLTPLHHAARLGFNKGLELLINKVGDVDLTDRKGFTAVHHAINSGMANADTIKLLKAGGADLEVQEHDGLTPLMLAVHLGRPSLTRQLLIQGANAHAKNGKGWTAMRLATASTSDHSAAKRILERALQGRLLGEY
ncbi:hypothetical protein CEP53_009996 [Fusarium sp. AF-6]|nr:hypothetical protein CEP53_009996 [Fusarium sp. AF-6]